jgi:hypothetical protein
MNLLKKGIIALSLILVSSLIYSQTYKPIIKVSKGQEFSYLTDMTMEMVQSMGGQEMKYVTSGTATVKNAISDILTDGKIEVLASNWDAKVKSTAMGKDTTMTFNGKVGSSFKFTLDKLGNVLSKAKNEEDKNDNKLPGFDNMMAVTVFCELPENPLNPGDKWSKSHNDSIEAGPAGKLGYDVKTEYTFVGKETVEGKNLYKITSASDVKISGKGNTQGMEFAIDGTGVSKNDIYLDPATGVIQTNKMNMELDMSIALSGQQNMTIPMTQKMTMNCKLIK